MTEEVEQILCMFSELARGHFKAGGGGEPWSSTITDFQGMKQTFFKGGKRPSRAPCHPLNESLHTGLDPGAI